MKIVRRGLRWLPPASLGVIQVHWQISEIYALAWDLALLLPLFYGWLALRIGSAALVPLLVLSPFLILQGYLVSGPLSVALAFDLTAWVLSALAVLAFTREPLPPAPPMLAQRVTRGARGRVLVVTMVLVLWVITFVDVDASRTFETGSLELRFSAAWGVVAVLLAACVRWRDEWTAFTGHAAAGTALATDRPDASKATDDALPGRAAGNAPGARHLWVLAVPAITAAAALASLPLQVEGIIDSELFLELSIGLLPGHLLYGSPFLTLPASLPVLLGMVRWWRMALLVLAWFALGYLAHPVRLALEAWWERLVTPSPQPEPLASQPAGDPEALMETIVVTADSRGPGSFGELHLVDALEAAAIVLAATLAAGALRPFWQSRGRGNAAPAPVAITLVALLVLAALPGRDLWSGWGVVAAMLGPASFLAGVTFGLRGAIAIPLATQLTLLAAALVAGRPEPALIVKTLMEVPFALFPIGVVGALARNLRTQAFSR